MIDKVNKTDVSYLTRPISLSLNLIKRTIDFYLVFTMKPEKLQGKLADLHPDQLHHFIVDLYQRLPEISDAIETFVLFHNPMELKKAIAKRIQSVKRGRRFVDYSARFVISFINTSIVTIV